MLVSHSKLALVSNADVKHSMEQRAESVTVARVHPEDSKIVAHLYLNQNFLPDSGQTLSASFCAVLHCLVMKYCNTVMWTYTRWLYLLTN